MGAFENFNKILQLKNDDDKHREWLKDYEGLYFAIGKNKKDLIYWSKEKDKYVYKDKLWDNWYIQGLNLSYLYAHDINKIQRHKQRIVIEFDDDNAKKNLEIVYEKLKKYHWGFIRSSHKGKCDYLWVEFNRELTEKEVEKFLLWIAPDNSIIDLNFKSDLKRFPVLFAKHWKYGTRENVVEFYEGEQIDYNSLKLTDTEKIIRKSNNKGYNTARVFTKKGQAEFFIQDNPLFYDRSGLFWVWNKINCCYEIQDETDILNQIQEFLNIDTINSKAKNEITNALKQVGRKNIPKDIKPTWIQFKDEIVDIQTGDIFKATPQYFVTNPIPYPLHEEKFEQTPVMDKIFEEWVGKDYVKTLYEIISYCLLPNYPLHRIFCFIGGGMNGKSCFLELLRKFIGDYNCCSTELDTLMTSRFEVTRLHKKLVCQMGETNFDEMSKTSILKKLCGGDLIGFEYKNKTPFEDKNYAKILIATNNLPSTTDKTIGFWRRWFIIDFPNQFGEKKDILDDIPQEEYKSLALKCCAILKDLLTKREFHNEGSIEDRMNKFETKSDFLQKFIDEFTVEDIDGYITCADFRKKFMDWCNSNRHRNIDDRTLGKKLKNKGFERFRKSFDWLNDGKGGQIYCYFGLKWKE